VGGVCGKHARGWGAGGTGACHLGQQLTSTKSVPGFERKGPALRQGQVERSQSGQVGASQRVIGRKIPTEAAATVVSSPRVADNRRLSGWCRLLRCDRQQQRKEMKPVSVRPRNRCAAAGALAPGYPLAIGSGPKNTGAWRANSSDLDFRCRRADRIHAGNVVCHLLCHLRRNVHVRFARDKN
jgi:hypothetical protein